MRPEFAATLVLAGLAVLVLPSLPRRAGVGRAAVMALCALCLLQYLVWRWANTLPPPRLAADWLWMLVLAVAVIIPTYNEPLEVVERSIVGALALDWPDVTVWVLDDGRRPWLRDYCAAKGARWVTRAGNDDGKAGNVNAWLAAGQGRAPFILVLDADFIPQRRFLRRVVGLFDDDGVALVQTPQSFFNPDPIQMNLLAGAAVADEQRFFYHHVQPALDAWGAAFCCGTSFVVRRDRLLAVGGIPTCTVTEDMMTTYALAERGWRTLYLDEPLSVGLAPEGLGEFVSQRARWCLGTVQALRSPRGPLRNRRLGWAHLLCFLNAQLFWLGTVPMLLLAMLAPAVQWWTGVPAFQADPVEFVAHFGPRALAGAAAMAWVSRWSVMPLLSGLAPLVVAPSALAAAATALLRPRGHRFKVTLKGGDRTRVVVHGRLLAWLLGLMALIVAGMALHPGIADGARGLAVNWGWSAYALVILFLGLLVSVELPRRRRQERFALDEPARLDGRPARLVDLSLTGACVAADAAGAVLHLPGVGDVPVRVVRRQELLSLEFVEPAAVRDALIRKLFTGPAVLPAAACDPGRAVRGVARRAVVSEV